MDQDGGIPPLAYLSMALVALLALLLSLSGWDPELAARALGASAAAAALAAALVGASVIVARGFLLDPLAGLAILYSIPGFLIASASWALDAVAAIIWVGSFTLAEWLRIVSSLFFALALWELGRSTRALIGARASEAVLAISALLTYAGALSVALAWTGARAVRVLEALVASLLLALALLAFLPIRRRRCSWGLALMTAGSAAFIATAPLARLLGGSYSALLANTLYTLSLILAATGLYVYGGEAVLLK